MRIKILQNHNFFVVYDFSLKKNNNQKCIAEPIVVYINYINFIKLQNLPIFWFYKVSKPYKTYADKICKNI